MEPFYFVALSAALSMNLADAAESRSDAPSHQGDIVVIRDGRVLEDSMVPLIEGDRVMTNSSGGAKLAFADCELDLPPASAATIGANPCGSPVKSLQAKPLRAKSLALPLSLIALAGFPILGDGNKLTGPIVTTFSRLESEFIRGNCSIKTVYIIATDTDIYGNTRIYVDSKTVTITCPVSPG